MFDQQRLPGKIISRIYSGTEVNELTKMLRKEGCKVERNTSAGTVIVTCPAPMSVEVFRGLKHPTGKWIVRHYVNLFIPKGAEHGAQ